MIYSQGGATLLIGYNYLMSNRLKWNNCFTKNNQDILPDLFDLALQEQTEDNLMVAISWAWFNGSFTVVAKPVKYLKLHYTRILFLIKKRNLK